MVRQLAATLSNSDEDICRMLRYFDIPPAHLQGLLDELRQGSECRVSEVPPQLESLVAELLSGTWFMTASKRGLCESLAGSRPGDGLADIVFGFIFKRVMARVVDMVSDFDLTVDPPIDLPCPPFIEVVWADDLAFSAIHQDAAKLIQIMEVCTALIFKQVLRHGMLPNLKAGKLKSSFLASEAKEAMLSNKNFSMSSSRRSSLLMPRKVSNESDSWQNIDIWERRCTFRRTSPTRSRRG